MTAAAHLLVMLSLFAGAPAGQTTGTLRIEVRANGVPVRSAEVSLRGQISRTDDEGRLLLAVEPGRVDVVISSEGFAVARATVEISAGETRDLLVELQPRLEEHVTVSATRTEKRLEDQPMRVEVLGREEIEEKLLMTPGDIVMMLNEMGGMRVQATSPSLGAASVRIQGMRGRYTRVLADGLPLFGEVGGLGLLQIPPMDLGQVEVIKGVASALYGAGAMGGVINLLARRPAAEAEQEFLLNRSTRGATDAIGYVSGPVSGRLGASLLAGGHWQRQTDVNGDRWADLPRYGRGVVRPRLFWDDGEGRSLFATAGATYEDRAGGTLDGEILPTLGQPYGESLRTRRYDAGLVGQFLLQRRVVVTVRGAIARARHDHEYGEILERDRHDTLFAEAAFRGSTGRHTWVAGAALEREVFTPRDVPRLAFAFTVPGAFLQHEVEVTPRLALSSSARLDAHSEYGTFVSPRFSALVRSGEWSSRLSVGRGFFAPSPLTEETEAAGLGRLRVEGPLEAERGVSASVDLSRTTGPWSHTATLFVSRIAHPIHVERTPAYVLRNLREPTLNTGLELLTTMRRAPWSATATYTFVRSRETVNGGRADVPLTPRHSIGVVAMWEEEDAGRVGVEWYYTGRQRLEDNPFRSTSRPYSILGILAERQLGPLRLFLNGENLTGVRQTRWDPLVRPARAADGRWTVDSWAPLDGRTINGGVRVRF